MNKLLIISGPTATGKTKVAIKLAEKFDGELVSADSRQVYKYMDIVTGKDIPQDKKIKIWGYNILRPDQNANASWYAGYSRKIIEDIWKRGKLPILVGGTGFYINALLGKYPYLDIPIDPRLRKKLSKLDSQMLYEMLFKKDPARATNLNNSDRNNKRRLIRALEVAQFTSNKKFTEAKKLQADVLWLGLKLPLPELKNKIAKRVRARLGADMNKEISYLKRNGYLHAAPAHTLGYEQWINYLQGKCTREGAVREWVIQEYKYAKRQIIWFNNQSEIVWFAADKKDINEELSARVRKWYS